ncbi:MAG: hypothetical protein LBG80_04875 [Bacteroidales bacterium]|nr:hypothetical protein [Bacteroidales bacterium]
MKSKFFFFAMLASIAASAQRTTPVTITNTKVDYATKIVTFDLSWKGSDANHRNEVWVFVDIQPVTGANTLGSWLPATLVPSATTVTADSGNQYSSLTCTIVSGNIRGVWIKGSAANTTNTFAATVKVTLASGTPTKFNACAYATDYPPNAASYSGGRYTLKGTKPFVVNGITVNDIVYDITTIMSLTDATGCPGGVGRDVIHNSGICAPGLTAVGSYCRDLVADGAFKGTCGQELEIKNNWYNAHGTTISSLGCPLGWRPTSASELECLWTTYFSAAQMSNPGWYLVPTSYSNSAWNLAVGVHCISCTSNSGLYRLDNIPADWSTCGIRTSYGVISRMCDTAILEQGRPTKCVR